MATRNIPSEDEVIGWMDSLSNWGRWGKDDQMGTLNLITYAKRTQAAALVIEGISVSCSRLIVPEIASDVTTIPPLHYMIRAGDTVPKQGGGGTSDFLGFSYHGLTISHLDALCHQTWNGKLYNGFDPLDVGSETKATVLNIDTAKTASSPGASCSTSPRCAASTGSKPVRACSPRTWKPLRKPRASAWKRAML